MGFSSASLFPARKRDAVIQGGTMGIDHKTPRKPREPVSLKARRTSETAGAFFIHSYKQE